MRKGRDLMKTAFDALISIRQTVKLYDQCLEDIRAAHQLTKIEIAIISFLSNNPGHDTVAEISDMRLLSKGNVSRAADGLIRRGLLTRSPDQVDRRRVHLLLTDVSAPIVKDIQEAGTDFIRLLFDGFTQEDRMTFFELNNRLIKNVSQNLERSVSLGRQ